MEKPNLRLKSPEMEKNIDLGHEKSKNHPDADQWSGRHRLNVRK